MLVKGDERFQALVKNYTAYEESTFQRRASSMLKYQAQFQGSIFQSH
jgi:hypothetical protein